MRSVVSRVSAVAAVAVSCLALGGGLASGAQSLGDSIGSLVGPPVVVTPGQLSEIHSSGPMVLQPQVLGSLPGASTSSTVFLQDDDELESTAQDCTSTICVAPELRNPLWTLLTPEATPAPTTSFEGPDQEKVIDPQMAVGPSAIVMALRDRIGFFDKGGHGLPELDGSPSVGFVGLCDFFKPLFPQINDGLGLPTTKTDADGRHITVANGFGLNCDSTTGGTYPPEKGMWSYDYPYYGAQGVIDQDDYYYPNDTFYDARVIWDPFRKRYWIGALAINNATPERGVVASPASNSKNSPGTRSATVRGARRARFAVAVSRTADPRDGWNMQSFDIDYLDDRCPQTANVCPQEYAADYVLMGISPKYLTVDIGGGPKASAVDTSVASKSTRQVFAIEAAPLAQQGGCQTSCRVVRAGQLKNPDGTAVGDSEWFQPVVHHDTVAGSTRSMWVAEHQTGTGASAKTTLVTLTLVDDGSTPPHFETGSVVGMRALTQPAGGTYGRAPQGGESGGLLTLSFSPGNVSSAVERDGTLHVAIEECAKSLGGGDCVTGIRYMQVPLPRPPSALLTSIARQPTTLLQPVSLLPSLGLLVSPRPTLDTTIGVREPGLDAVGAQRWYGFPDIEVNKDGDAVLEYVRSASDVPAEARYNVFGHNDLVTRTSRQLASGDSWLGGNRVPHYLDMSVDPFDDTSVWMLVPYAHEGTWGLRVGKVFGVQHPDRSVEAATLRYVHPSGGPLHMRAKFTICNFGDGLAAAAAGGVQGIDQSGSRTGPGIPFSVSGLASGACQGFAADLPAGSNAGSVRITVGDAGQQEYTLDNNQTSAAVAVSDFAF